MAWVLVVSEDVRFQREIVGRLRDHRAVVGATGDSSARRLFGALDVATVIVNGRDDAGRRFLSALGSAPRNAVPEVIAVGATPQLPWFRTTSDPDSAVSALVD